MNWVDRRFAKERNIGRAVELWNSVVSAIHNAVESFNREEKYGHAQLFSQNGHLLRIDVNQTQPKDGHVFLADPVRRVSIAFSNDQPAVTVSLDANPPATFAIEADETHCFLKFRGAEISADEFSERALKDAFFTPKTYPSPRLAKVASRRHSPYT